MLRFSTGTQTLFSCCCRLSNGIFTQMSPFRGRSKGGPRGHAPPPNLGWKIKTQLPRTHVGTAATINNHKTAHKHSSLVPFQTYDKLTTPKSVQLQGALAPGPLTRGSAPGLRWGHSPQTPIIGSRSALAIYGPLQSLLLDPPLTIRCLSAYRCAGCGA